MDGSLPPAPAIPECRREIEWTPERIADLTRLVIQGETYSEIGRRLGISKNACLAKAHRLHLPARPSPIKRGHRATAQSSSRHPPGAARPGSRGSSPARFRETTPARGARKAPAPVFLPDPAAVNDSCASVRRCAWPLWGNEERPMHRYCGARIDGEHGAYCGYHAIVSAEGSRRADEVLRGENREGETA